MKRTVRITMDLVVEDYLSDGRVAELVMKDLQMEEWQIDYLKSETVTEEMPLIEGILV